MLRAPPGSENTPEARPRGEGPGGAVVKSRGQQGRSRTGARECEGQVRRGWPGVEPRQVDSHRGVCHRLSYFSLVSGSAAGLPGPVGASHAGPGRQGPGLGGV